jgi:CRP-like cAMP-binding protein
VSDVPRIVELLSSLKVFPGFEPEELEAFAGVLLPVRLAADEVLFREGQRGDACYVVAEGKLRVWVEREADVHDLAVLTRGDFFGQMALLDGGKRSATVSAMGPAVVLKLSRSEFDLVFQSGSSFAFKFVDVLTRILVVQLRNANRRLLAAAGGEPVTPRATHDPAVQKVLKEVTAQTMAYGLSDVDPDDLEVVVPDGLRYRKRARGG